MIDHSRQVERERNIVRCKDFFARKLDQSNPESTASGNPLEFLQKNSPTRPPDRLCFQSNFAM